MRSKVLAAPILAVTFALAGCDDDPAPPPPAPPAAANAARPNAAPNAPGQNAANRADGGPPPLSLPNGEQAFVESGTVRDPFRDYSQVNTGRAAVVDVEERLVILPNYGIEDLRLVAVVLGTDSPYAMVTDPSGRGTILRRGMLVGRREIVRNPDGQDSPMHWRVARVLQARLRRTSDGQLDEQPAELVFERHDPSNRATQITERSLALGARANDSTPTSTTALPSSVVIPGVGAAPPAYLPGALGSAPPTAPGRPGGAPPSTTTTVIVQAPPAQAAAPREIPPSTAPPPVRVTGDESALNPR